VAAFLASLIRIENKDPECLKETCVIRHTGWTFVKLRYET